MCNCRHTAPITPFNTGLRCCTAPSSHGHHQSGDFFPVNNDWPYRIFYSARRTIFLASFHLSAPRGTFCLWSFFSFHVVVLCLLSTLLFVLLTACGRGMTLPLDTLPRLIGVIIYTVTYSPRPGHPVIFLCNHLELLMYSCLGHCCNYYHNGGNNIIMYMYNESRFGIFVMPCFEICCWGVRTLFFSTMMRRSNSGHFTM